MTYTDGSQSTPIRACNCGTTACTCPDGDLALAEMGISDYKKLLEKEDNT